jgi:hypothetical protein
MFYEGMGREKKKKKKKGGGIKRVERTKKIV